MSRISAKTTLVELAALVSQALEHAGIIATLSGGAAVLPLHDTAAFAEFFDGFMLTAR